MKKVLVCDDDDTVVDLLTLVLETEGYAVIPAVNAEQARERFLDERPDAMILDVHMPRMTGFALMEALEKAGELRGTPVVFVTGSEKPEDKGKAEALGARFFTKPFRTDALLETVRSLLSS